MFAESTRFCLYERSIYLYIMNICSSVGTLSLSRPFFLYYTISLYRKGNTLSRTFFTPHLSYPFHMFLIYSFIIYSIYRYREYFSATFTTFPALSHSFIILLIYRRWNTLPALFYPFIKWTPFPPPLSYLFLCLLFYYILYI